MSRTLAICALLGVAAATAPGSAVAGSITLGVIPYGAAGFGPAAGSTVITFDEALPSGVTITASADSRQPGIFNGLHSGIAAPPYGDVTNYYATGIGTTTISFAGFNSYLGLDWGSVDDYNSIAFFNGSTRLATFTGTQIEAAADGNQGESGTFYVDFLVPDLFTSIQLTSTQFSFEVDDVAFIDPPGPVPEPATLALLGLPVVALGIARRRWQT